MTAVYAKSVKAMLSFDSKALDDSSINLDDVETVSAISKSIDNYKPEDTETYYVGDVIQLMSELN